MADRELIGVDIDVRLYFFPREFVVVLKPVHHGGAIGFLQGANDLGAITGREDRRLMNQGEGGKLLQGADQVLRVKGHPFPDIDRGCFVVDPER